MLGRLQRVRRNEVVGLEEITADVGHEEYDDRKNHQEEHDADQVLDRVVRMRVDAVEIDAGLRVLRLPLDLDAVRVVRPDFVQRHQVYRGEDEQHQGHCDNVESVKAIERHVGDRVIAANPGPQLVADERHRREEIDDHLRAPVGHLPPGQQIAEERLGHQREVKEAADDPQQLAWLAIAAVEQAAEHVQVHDNEEGGGPRGMHVADDPAAQDVSHDVFDRFERLGGVRLVVHRQENTRDDLQHQDEGGERAEVVPEVEVLRRDVLAPLVLPQLGQRKAIVDPGQESLHVGPAFGWLIGWLLVSRQRASRGFDVLADHDPRIGEEPVRRDDEVRRRRNAFVHAAGEIELGLVARAEKTAEPVRTQVRRRNFRAECRRAAQVCADADGNEDFRLDRAVLVFCVGRLVIDCGFRIGELGIELGQTVEHFLRAMDHPHDFATPLDVDLLAELEFADIDLDRHPRRLRALAGPHAHGERDGCRNDADRAHGCGGAEQKPAFPVVYTLIGCHSPGPQPQTDRL